MDKLPRHKEKILQINKKIWEAIREFDPLLLAEASGDVFDTNEYIRIDSDISGLIEELIIYSTYIIGKYSQPAYVKIFESEVQALKQQSGNGIEYCYEGEYHYSTKQERVNSLLIPIFNEITLHDGVDLVKSNILENILRSTGNIIYEKRIEPNREDLVSNCISDYLKYPFPSTINKPTIPSVLKNYKPDIAISENKSLVEYKYIKEEKEVGPALDGILADSRAYSDDNKWLKFYSVFYMNENYQTEARISAHFTNCGIDPNIWKVIVVIGNMSVKVKPKQGKAITTKRKVGRPKGT